MAFRLTCMVLSLMMFWSLSYAHTDASPPQRYCGRRLARVIASVCYDGLPSEKSAEAGTIYGRILPADYDVPAARQWARAAWRQARGLDLPSRGQRLGVHECCRKACSVEDLLSFCN